MSVLERIPKKTGRRAATSGRATNTIQTLCDAATIHLAQDGRVNLLAPLLHALVMLFLEGLEFLFVSLCGQSEHASTWKTKDTDLFIVLRNSVPGLCTLSYIILCSQRTVGLRLSTNPV
jgi:hypothetical protein